MEIKEILHKSPSKKIVYKWNSLLAKASWCQRERWHHLPYMRQISLVFESDIVTDVKSRLRTEYLIPTDNILVFDWHFNLTKKYNLNGRLWYNLIRYFDHLVVAYFFVPPCIWRKRSIGGKMASVRFIITDCIPNFPRALSVPIVFLMCTGQNQSFLLL